MRQLLFRALLRFDGFAQGFGQGGFPRSRKILQQNMATGNQSDNRQINHIIPASTCFLTAPAARAVRDSLLQILIACWLAGTVVSV